MEAAKLAPRQCHELAVIYQKEKQRGNGNRATLAVARKMAPVLLLAVLRILLLAREKIARNIGLHSPITLRQPTVLAMTELQ